MDASAKQLDGVAAGHDPDYFLIAVSTRENLDLCIRHRLAGFPSSANGLWTFVDVAEGDMVSFLYGARVHNLYRVVRKYALTAAEDAPPWEPIVFLSGRRYVFTYRLDLELVRELSESVVRSEFAYVAENLLLRAGYAKTHFQADRTTLQCVSRLGQMARAVPYSSRPAQDWQTYVPQFVLKRKAVSSPTQAYLSELVLQAAIRAKLRDPDQAGKLVSELGLAGSLSGDLELLGEKALSRGHVDILVRESTSVGISRSVAIEVKRSVAKLKDVEQAARYRDELGDECVGVVLTAQKFQRAASTLAHDVGVTLVQWDLPVAEATAINFADVVDRLCLGVLTSK